MLGAVVLPGRPASRPQALSVGRWGSRDIVTYITGNAFAILADPQTVLQTIYPDDHDDADDDAAAAAQPLEAIALDEASGKIATCTATSVRIYRPAGGDHAAPRWTLQTSFPHTDRNDDGEDPPPACVLSWGASEELLVASRALNLYSTAGDGGDGQPTRVWHRPLPTAAHCAAISPDSGHIASAGRADALVKVWRRLSYGVEDVQFVLSYLRHAAPVAEVRWRRRPAHPGQTADSVLYTFCIDGVIRVWVPAAAGDRRLVLVPWGRIDAGGWSFRDEVSPPEQQQQQPPPLPQQNRHCPWVAILDAPEFAAAIEGAVSAGGLDDRLVAVAAKYPEICLVFDGAGDMSAWALEDVAGTTAGPGGSESAVFNLAHVRANNDFNFLRSTDPATPARLHAYYDRSAGQIHILVHLFDGRIGVYGAPVAELFAPTAAKIRLWYGGVLSGHSAPIRKIVRDFSGDAVVSRTDDGEAVVWRHVTNSLENRTRLARQSVITTKGVVVSRIAVLRRGRFVVLLCPDVVMLWDCRVSPAALLARHEHRVTGRPLCLIILPRRAEAGSGISDDAAVAHLATITAEGKGVAWEVTALEGEVTVLEGEGDGDEDGDKKKEKEQEKHSSGSIREFCRFDLADSDASDLAYVLPVDPAGPTPPAVSSLSLDAFARDVAISYTRAGRVAYWTARVSGSSSVGEPGNGSGAGRVEWLATCATETGIRDPALVSGSTLKKAALVDATRTRLTVWDVGGSRLEYDEDFGGDAVRDLDWTSTPDSQSILAVGFRHRVVLVSQMRYDYLNGGPAWAPVREIGLGDATPHPIGDSAWLSGGHLVVGAGHQLFVYERGFDPAGARVDGTRLPRPRARKRRQSQYQQQQQQQQSQQQSQQQQQWPPPALSLDLFEVVRRLNGPLPVFHPQFLSQCVLAGKARLVRRILTALQAALRLRLHNDDEPIDDYLGISPEEFYLETPEYLTTASSSSPKTLRRLSLDHRPGDDDDEGGGQEDVFSDDVAARINDRLTRTAIPQLSRHEQIQLADMVECAAAAEAQRRSMDANGSRFVLLFRQHALRKGRTSAISLSWREINWALHSSSQDVLAEAVVVRHYRGRIRWEDARESGLFMWLSDPAAVRRWFEEVARAEYGRSDPRNPTDCSLFYLALRRKAVLQGLWRVATWNREQVATQRLLANDFGQARWRTAALKNAYALLSKHRFEYAAAFFLLADRLEDAVAVCLSQLRDLQLAVAIARVYEGGDDGPVLRRLLEGEVLALAAAEGNRWLASWAYWMLGRRDMAARALVSPPVNALLKEAGRDHSPPPAPAPSSQSFLASDPALVVLYAQLRGGGASQVAPRDEWDFVLGSARVYDRMGCDLLALDLVRNWVFLQPERSGGEAAAKTAAALTPALSPAPTHSPTVFHEPEASSLLDAFGF